MSTKSNEDRSSEMLSARKIVTSDNFDRVIEAVRPTVSLDVPNTLTGEGSIHVEMIFRSMDDFSAEAISENVPDLKRLVQARDQLVNLLKYIDGKHSAEEHLNNLLHDPELLEALARSESKPGRGD